MPSHRPKSDAVYAPSAVASDVADIDRDLRRYRILATIVTAAIAVLVVAGGVVRLTGSGLGCDDWPNCNTERFVDVSSGHTAIEQVNRLLSALIGIPTLLLVVVALRLRRNTVGLLWPAVGVLVTVLANGVVGGIAVRSDLHPMLVQSHFLLAMLSISFAMVAVERSRATPRRRLAVDTATLWLTVLFGALTAAALATGTVVTGAGPHAGDEEVRRLGIDISSAARAHSTTVLVTVAVAVALAWRLRRLGSTAAVTTSLSSWIFVALVQGATGYIQYFNGVPELLVGVHIALATAVWVATMRVVLLVVPTAER